MSIQNQMKKDRDKAFPYIKDFSKKETLYRNMNTKDMDYLKWFWHKPEAYILMKYGIYIVAAFNFEVGGFISRYFELNVLSYILLFVGIIFNILFFIKFKYIKFDKDVTFYDLWIRDYKEEDELEKVKGRFE